MLVASAEPNDNVRLSAHFAALAEHYAAEARRHTSMSHGFVGNPNRNLATGIGAHCQRLAALNTESAATVRELATHHHKLAVGLPSAPPRDAARFESGAGAPAPTAREIRALASRARTPADFHALEEHFLTLARRYSAEANEHVATGQSYRGTRIAQAAAHCDRLLSLSRESAEEVTAAAAMYEAFARLAAR
jgi:hypothetical protein